MCIVEEYFVYILVIGVEVCNKCVGSFGNVGDYCWVVEVNINNSWYFVY